jgi:hypothetical protein
VAAKVWRVQRPARAPVAAPAVPTPVPSPAARELRTRAALAADAARAPAEITVPAGLPDPAELPETAKPRVPERARLRATATASPGPAAAEPVPAQAPAPPRPARPVVTIKTDSPEVRPLHVVERALRAAPGSRADAWREQVVIVPGGHRPGRPDQVQRDQARARLPLPGPARIVVLGCTAGAGQTVTTLLAGQLLASLRGEAVAVLDLKPGPGSLTERARAIPRLLPGQRSAAGDVGERGLQVVSADRQDGQPGDAGKLIDAVVARYPLTLADPAADQVPRALQVAEQLVLVAPASADAAGSLAMTLEWLEANNHRHLARAAITVLNGVSAQTAAQVDSAAVVASGRCRAVVRVPWDYQLAAGGPLGIAAVRAYTALAGLLVSGLADPALASSSSQ